MPEHNMLSHDSEQIRVLTVNSGEHLDGILYKLKKGFSRDLIIAKIVLYSFSRLYLKIFGYHSRFLSNLLYFLKDGKLNLNLELLFLDRHLMFL